MASFMIFVLRKAGMMSSEYDSQVSDKEIVDFNYQFEIYDKPDNTFFDILTVANLAYDVNKRNGYDLKNSVTIKIYEGSTVKYSILPNRSLTKDCFFNGDNVSSSEYIYNKTSSGNSIIEKYASKKVNNEEEFQYRFECIKTEYNTGTTGKIRLMEFRRENN